MNPELLHYVQAQSAKGFSMDQIIAQLKNAGWSDAQIKPVIVFMNNNYANTQLNIAQTFASSATYGPPKKGIKPKVIEALVITALVVGVLLAGYIAYAQ